ncbi:kinase-like domain-containing protein [Chytridium lagenaria]|nr:kinase-like domain-containing protein [Chytridium lagenaria]
MGHTYEQLSAKFELGDTLGTGAFSEVKIATERATGNKYAIKIVDKSKCKGKESMIETEVNILMRVRHEHIIQLYEMYEIESKIYLVMELVTGGELFDEIVKIGKYTEADAAHIVYKILLAIDYLHTEGIAHRDLKPENLLLSDRTSQAKIMISDFGLSKIFSDDEVMRTACGTPGYVAPEVLKRQGYGREVDLWSLGVITYILLCGYPPFYDQNNVELFKQIMAGRYEFDRPWWDNISETVFPAAKDFIRKLLVLDPRQRATARSCLNHPFITNNCGVHPNVSQAAGSHLAQQDTSTHSVPPLRPEPMNAQYYNPQAHSETASTPPDLLTTAVQAHLSVTVTILPPLHRPHQHPLRHPPPQQQPKLTQHQHPISNPTSLPAFNKTSKKAQSFKGNSHQSVHQDKHQHAAAIRLSADDASQPGRPLGVKSSLDDSGCVTSNDSISGRKVRWSWKPAKWGW